MFDSYNLKKVFYSQQAYTALRMTLGSVLPGVVLLLIFNQSQAAIACALGAFCISLVDVPAPLWRKHQQMLLGTLIVSVVTLSGALALQHPVALWTVLLTVCFLAGLAVAYGLVATQMGVTAMVAIVMVLAQRGAGIDLWAYLTWFVIGGLWYTYFCLAMCRIFQHQMARRSLAECLYATADYLNARSQFYMPAIPLEQCHRSMIAAQVTVIDTQQAARDLVLNNLFVGQKGPCEPQHIRLFNILIDVIDMHDSVLAMQVDFESLRNDFAQTDVLDFMRDLLTKSSRELARVAEAVVKGIPLAHRFNVKAELRALEYETQLVQGLETASELNSVYTRGKTIAVMMEKLIQDLESVTNTSNLSLAVVRQKYYEPTLQKQIPWSSPTLKLALRFALRLTIAIALGMAISDSIGEHSVWIVITIMVVLRPGFGLTQQRNKHRLIGTLFGCLAALALLWGEPSHLNLFLMLAVSMLLSFSFTRLNYLISVFFITIALLLLYHFMTPGLTLIGHRAMDTLIGAVIGAVAGYIFPTWEYQLLAPQITAVMQRCRRYAREVFAPKFDPVEYRFERRNALVELTTLSASYQRLLQDPIKKQCQAAEVGELVLQCNILVSEIASLAYIRAEQTELPTFRSTAQVIDKALAGTLLESDEVALLTTTDELFSMRQSAINIMKICAQLTLPGLNSELENSRSIRSYSNP